MINCQLTTPREKPIQTNYIGLLNVPLKVSPHLNPFATILRALEPIKMITC